MHNLCLSNVFSILKKRPEESNKGDYGTLLSICGSAYYRGAAGLSAIGALRTGVGILRVATTEKVIVPLSSLAPEAVFLPLAEGEKGEIGSFDTKTYFREFPKTSAVLCGCGITTFGAVPEIVRDITVNAPCPLVLDADALNSLANNKEILLEAKNEVIITPHIGEFSRLCGVDIGEIKNNIPKYGKEFAKKYGVILILKGSNIHIFYRDSVYVSNFGNAGLARGGSGDILAGMTASFVAQGYSGIEAAICACVLHQCAADRTAKRLSIQGMLPHDIIYDLCEIFKEEGY
ncbi:MAG: NAD(P)H-hydrate dehydratase [Clostridia bacterium]|nr:NAD(P)H-hydrate dehydratase [Clostridia bacterium]